MGEALRPLLAIIAVLGLGLIWFGSIFVRRALLSRGFGAFDCSLRHETIQQRTGWIHGFARYEDDRLDWFRVFGLRWRPSESLSRRRLVILERHVPDPMDAPTMLPDWVVVRCAYGSVIVELAMSEPAFNGLAAWLESAPPGQHLTRSA